jgi:hypothetical protein
MFSTLMHRLTYPILAILFCPFDFRARKDFNHLGFPILTLSVRDERHSGNASRTQTFYFIHFKLTTTRLYLARIQYE